MEFYDPVALWQEVKLKKLAIHEHGSGLRTNFRQIGVWESV